jgi:hypothetical protein
VGGVTTSGGQLNYIDNPNNDDPAANPDGNSTWHWSADYYYNNSNPLLADWRVEFLGIYNIDHQPIGYIWTVYYLVNDEWVPSHSGQLHKV